MPTLRQLEYLVALADLRHFGRAAQASHVSQPSLSQQVRALEQRLGLELVERNQTRVPGRHFLRADGLPVLGRRAELRDKIQQPRHADIRFARRAKQRDKRLPLHRLFEYRHFSNC